MCPSWGVKGSVVLWGSSLGKGRDDEGKRKEKKDRKRKEKREQKKEVGIKETRGIE